MLLRFTEQSSCSLLVLAVWQLHTGFYASFALFFFRDVFFYIPAKWSIDRLIDWLTDWLTDWLIDWLIDLFIYSFIDSLIDLLLLILLPAPGY